MKNPLRIAILLALIWIVFKITLFYLEYSDEGFTAGVLINVLFVLIAGSWGVYAGRAKNNYQDSHFLDDYKNALKGSVVYTIIISLFIYFYYSNIDPSYMERKITNKIELAQEQTSTKEKFKKLKENNPNLKAISRKVYVQNVKKDAQTIHSAYVQSTLSLLALMLLSLLYGLGITLIFRKVVFRNHH